MILVGNSLFGYSDLGMFITDTNIGTPTEIKLQDSIVDELYIKTDTSTPFSTTKETWLPSTVIKAPFIDDLHGGNMNLAGLTITELRFKRRKIDSLEWLHFATIPFDPKQNIYEVIDRMIESYEEYEYAITPYSTGIEGDYKTAQIEATFDDCFIFDKNNNYKLMYNFELSEIPYNIPSSQIETLGSKFPIIVYNSDLNYRSSSIKCMLVSDRTILDGSVISGKDEKILRTNIMAFLTNKKPKIIKDASGNFIMILVSNPKIVPNNSLNGLIYDLSFDFIEIGDSFDEQTLINADLLDIEV